MLSSFNFEEIETYRSMIDNCDLKFDVTLRERDITIVQPQCDIVLNRTDLGVYNHLLFEYNVILRRIYFLLGVSKYD